MKKIKKIEMKLLVSYIALFVVGVLAVGTIGVAAYSGTATTVMENVTIQNYNVGGGNLGEGEIMIGASNAPVHYVYDYVNGFYVNGSQVFDTDGDFSLAGQVTADIDPNTTATYNMGSYNLSWNNIFASGTIYTDDIVAVSSTWGETNVSTTAFSASSYWDVNGATTLDGAVILGDSVGDSITITGKLGTFYVTDGSTTSTHAKNSLTIGEATSYNVGKFYVDSSGNVFASGTLKAVGATTLSSSLTVSGDTTLEKVITGGTVNSTSTTGIVTTLKESDFTGYGLWYVTPNTASLTYTLPGSSTLTTWIPNSGDRDDFLVRNATTTAGINITFAAGSGSLWETTSSTLNVNASTTVKVTCFRRPSTDVSCMLDN